MKDVKNPMVTIVHNFGRETITVQNKVARDLVDGRDVITRKEMDKFEASGIEFDHHPLGKSK